MANQVQCPKCAASDVMPVLEPVMTLLLCFLALTLVGLPVSWYLSHRLPHPGGMVECARCSEQFTIPGTVSLNGQ